MTFSKVWQKAVNKLLGTRKRHEQYHFIFIKNVHQKVDDNVATCGDYLSHGQFYLRDVH
jgi:hypothetical protein